MDELRDATLNFLRAGLEKTGWSAYKWGKKAKVASTTITRPLNDPEWKYYPKLKTLTALAAAAGMELPSILKDSETMDTAPVRRNIPVLGDVRAGSWERIPDEPDIREWLPMEVPEYEGANLFAVRVVGRSMDLLYPDGTYVICAPPAEAGLQEGDCVLVRRRDSSGRAETTLKQIERRKGGGYMLMPRSSDQNHQDPLPLPTSADVANQEGIEILGVVLIAYNKDRRGRGPVITLS